MYLLRIYNNLKKAGLCSSAYDFSVNYLGKAPSYMGQLKTRRIEPSIDVIATLQHALTAKAQMLESINYPSVQKKRDLLIELADQVATQQQQRCSEQLAQSKSVYKLHSVGRNI